MKRYFIVLLSVFTLVSCNGTTDKKPIVDTNLPDYLAQLSWADSADAEADARKAIANKDYRLWVMAGRGGNAPGISGDASALKNKCGVRYVQGSTDAVRGEQHMVLLQKAYDYATTYNQIIQSYCQ